MESYVVTKLHNIIGTDGCKKYLLCVVLLFSFAIKNFLPDCLETNTCKFDVILTVHRR